MDTRDYLAGQALNALIQSGEDNEKGKELRKLVTSAYRIADAMLEERERLSHNLATDDSENDAASKANGTNKKPKSNRQSHQNESKES